MQLLAGLALCAHEAVLREADDARRRDCLRLAVVYAVFGFYVAANSSYGINIWFIIQKFEND